MLEQNLKEKAKGDSLVLLTLLSWLQALAVLASRLAWVRNVALALSLRVRRVPIYYRRAEPSPQIRRHRLAKPDWVHKEVLRLKALMADAGCRVIADTFNRLHANAAMSVGKTFVSELVRKHKYAIQMLRRKRVIRKRREVKTASLSVRTIRGLP